MQGGYYDFRRPYIEKIPIKIPAKKNQEALIAYADKNILTNNKFHLLTTKIQNYLLQKFHFDKLTKKLQNWQELEFGDFTKELIKTIKANNKVRVKEGIQEIPTLTKKDEFEWLELFEENKQKAQELKTQIDQTDKEIDAMVYELYGLTEEEIEIVENS